MKLSKTPH